MIKNISFLIVILALSLFSYNVFYNVIKVKINAQYEELERIPVMVVSINDTLLYQISTELDSLDFIEKIQFTMADTLRKNLIKRYKLDAANRYLDNSYLPNIMKIYIKKGKFDSNSKTELATILGKYKKDVKIKYNDELWQEITARTEFLKDFFKNLSYTYWGVIALLLFFLRLLFESINGIYWQSYFKSGGVFSKWFIVRLNQSIIISVVSILLSYMVFYPLKVLSPYFMPPDIKILLYEFAGILCVNLISILLLRRKYD